MLAFVGVKNGDDALTRHLANNSYVDLEVAEPLT